MVEDARFHDADPAGPLRLWATDADDLQVISALCQDAILPANEMRYSKSNRTFALLINRFRWEDRRTKERVQTVLIAGDVTRVQGSGLAPGDADTVLSLLSLEWHTEQDGAGAFVLTFAGDGQVRVAAECLDLRLHDVTRPYTAPSGRKPEHPE